MWVSWYSSIFKKICMCIYTWTYWVGWNVHVGFPLTMYGKNWTNFLANPIYASVQFSSVQSLSCVRPFATSWTTARQASLSITSSQSLLILMSIELVMPSNHLILLPSLFPSIRVFSHETVLHIRWRTPKYWSFSFSISPSSEYSGLISFRMDWLDLLAVQGTLKSLLQHHSSKASILRHSAFLDCEQSNSHIHAWLLEKP